MLGWFTGIELYVMDAFPNIKLATENIQLLKLRQPDNEEVRKSQWCCPLFFLTMTSLSLVILNICLCSV